MKNLIGFSKSSKRKKTTRLIEGKGKGKGRLNRDCTKYIENYTSRRTTMSKRRKTLFKQAKNLYNMCGMHSFIITITEQDTIRYHSMGKLEDLQNCTIFGHNPQENTITIDLKSTFGELIKALLTET